MVKEYNASRAAILRAMRFPDIDSPANVKILWFDSTEPDKIIDALTIGLHSHSFYELHLMFAGEFIYEIGGKVFEIKNDAVLIPPNTPHTLIKHKGDFLKISIAFTLEGEIGEQILAHVHNSCVFSYSNDIVKNLEEIFKLCENPDSFTPTLTGNRIFEIIYTVFKTLNQEMPQNIEAVEPRLYVAKRFIKNNRHVNITCNDVALECCLSTKQLNRIFKKYTNKTLNEYIIADKAAKAEKLLLQGDMSIKEIGSALGFENDSSFSLFFKRYFGVSPTVYKNSKAK